jgi:hypothetical protein
MKGHNPVACCFLYKDQDLSAPFTDPSKWIKDFCKCVRKYEKSGKTKVQTDGRRVRRIYDSRK